jgi:hypothetical protein
MLSLPTASDMLAHALHYAIGMIVPAICAGRVCHGVETLLHLQAWPQPHYRRGDS